MNLQLLFKLEYLDVSHLDEVTDESVVHIATLTQLRKLNLQRCSSITDLSLDVLMERLPYLRELDVRDCTGLSVEHVRFYQSSPRVDINW